MASQDALLILMICEVYTTIYYGTKIHFDTLLWYTTVLQYTPVREGYLWQPVSIVLQSVLLEGRELMESAAADIPAELDQEDIETDVDMRDNCWFLTPDEASLLLLGRALDRRRSFIRR